MIHAINLGKAYPARLGQWARLGEWLGLMPRAHKWVLREISFQIARGEAVGIIGSNGAGKSTLLKLLAQTTYPTEGRINIDGEVAALLELGIGFHAEFTGRQNAYLAGQMLGRTRREIEAVIEEIRAFADIGEYFDWPVRTYSSGMYVRLAFSVATAYRPDILIVDEALAVGDQYFQHKSFARIRQYKEQGTTLLFVSHDPTAVKSLCDRAILLGEGRVMLDGSPDDVLDYYNALIAERENRATLEQVPSEFAGRSGNGKARIEEVTLHSEGMPAKILRVGESATLKIAYIAHEELSDLTLGLLIKDRTGYEIFGTNTWHLPGLPPLGQRPGETRVLEFDFAAINLGPGSYSVTIALHSHADHLNDNYDWWERALVFQVMPGNDPVFIGVAALRPTVSLS